MEYNIEHLELIPKGEERNYLEKYLEKFIKKMSFIPKKYRKTNTININISKPKDSLLKIKVSANLNTGIISYEKSGHNIKEIVPAVFDEFTEKIVDEIDKIRKQFSQDKKNSFLNAISFDKKDLSKLDEKEKEELFKNIITVLLPGLKGYVKRRIMSAKLAKLKPLSNIDYKDIINEVVLRVYQRYKNNIENIKDVNIWLIQEADNILNEILDRQEYEKISYEELLNNELEQLEEEFTVDGEGELVMTEDLDEYDTDFGVEEIILISKGESDFIEKLEKDKTSLKNKIYDELIKLPLRYQSIYDLYYFENMEIDEIAKIKNMDTIKVEAIIISIKELLTEKLFN